VSPAPDARQIARAACKRPVADHGESWHDTQAIRNRAKTFLGAAILREPARAWRSVHARVGPLGVQSRHRLGKDLNANRSHEALPWVTRSDGWSHFAEIARPLGTLSLRKILATSRCKSESW
jgi:hypothetical protein